MADIDIGAPAIDRGAAVGAGLTIIALDNPANASGTITSIEVWSDENLTGFRVGTFYNTGGNNYKCRDSETIGAVAKDAKRTFAVTITVVAGDFIGCYYDAGDLEYDTSGYAGTWRVAGEWIDPDDEKLYTTYDSAGAMSLYGEGVLPVVGRSFGFIIG